MTRIFFTTDVHGSERCYRKFLNAAKFYRADVLILGGDITGKLLVPIVERSDGTYEASVFGERTVFAKDKLAETRRTLQDAGQYSFVTTEAGLSELKADRTKEEAVFNGAMAEVIRSWVKLTEEKLKGTAVKCYVSPGNDDRLELDSELVDSGQFVNPENRVVELDGGFEMITLGYANPTPWKSPREVSEGKLGEMIEALASKVDRPEDAVYNLHVPPVNTELDKAPAVSRDFTYVKEGLGIKVIHAGSSAVRKAIEVHAPLLGLHGHIHESKGFARIGRTLCLNPGSEYSDGVLRGALVNLQPGKGGVHDFVLTSG
ncbi:MAG: metallophosphoesterase [Nitrososphaerota archaeon]|nr:metallophosphoesterase [Nitrososphaerota archaeon]MDG7018861.1 metallophosphoesterase [Nitrososphaerota archaeon]MDG7027118.1 metallophosphoesterase [Nitrososphaerota archaeon]